MKIIETYGNYIEKWSNENPGRARWLLKTGWKAQNLKFRFAPDKRLMSAEQYLARLMMDTMIRPLERPEESAIVSIFTPCEILQEAGLHPYNVEGFSCYLSASKAERAFLQQAENTGISETLCSYHKTFIGAAQKKVLPISHPRNAVFTFCIFVSFPSMYILKCVSYGMDVMNQPSFFTCIVPCISLSFVSFLST